jgi:hypothetical protein
MERRLREKYGDAYTRLNPLQKALVDLLNIFYETERKITPENANYIFRRLVTLCRDDTVHRGGFSFDNYAEIIVELLGAFYEDAFKETVGEGNYVIAMDSIKILYEYERRLGERSLPVVLPHVFTDRVREYSTENRIWVQHETDILAQMQPAFDAENAIMYENRPTDALLRMHIAAIESALQSNVWTQLNEHAAVDKESRDGYDELKKSFVTAKDKAIEMLPRRRAHPYEVRPRPNTRSTRRRSNPE